MIIFFKKRFLDAKKHHFGTTKESDFLNFCSQSTLQLGLDFINIHLHGHDFWERPKPKTYGQNK